MNNEIKTIDERFADMQKLLSVIYPSLITYYCMCDKRHVDGITLRLNTKTGTQPVIEYGEQFVNILSIPTFTALISVELFRLLLHHPTSRMMPPPDRTIMASNIICTDDRILNFKIDPEIKTKFPTLTQIKMVEPNFDIENDCYLEKIFAILSKQDEQQSKSGDGDGNESENSGGAVDGSNGNSSFEDESDAISKHFSRENQKKNTERWGENEIIDAQVSDEVNRTSAKDWGNMPGHMQKQIMLANTKKFDPRSVIKRFVTSVFSDEMTFTRMKPNRRLQGAFTGIIPGKRHKQKAKVLFAVDTSGSMSENEIEKAIGFIQSSLKHAECHYCFWDAICGPITQEKHANQKMELCGKGGTDPTCVIEKITKDKLTFDGIVYITDCYFDFPQPAIKTKIFILQTDDANKVPDWCKYSVKMSDLQKVM